MELDQLVTHDAKTQIFCNFKKKKNQTTAIL